MLIAVAVITWILSYIIEGFGVGILFHTATTILLLCRMKAIRVKFNKFTILEILGLVIPTSFALLFKRFKLWKTVGLIAVRGIFYLYVKYDFENFRYFTKTYTNYDDDEIEQEEEDY